MRTFIAIELPQEIIDTLARAQGRLKQSEADVKWVTPRNIHLTLKFLGEIDENMKNNIGYALKDACRAIRPFHIALSCLGAFPKTDFPRVIWVGIAKGDAETKTLAMAVEEKLATLGVPREDKAFSSHITIGRVRSGKNRVRLVAQMQNLKGYLEEKTNEVLISKITFFKSTLTPSGPLYETLQEIPLTTA